jgi:hypothetical protein
VIEIRSYRRVFDLERRIYRIDRLRLNPTGVPVRGIVYFLALVATSLVVGAVPLLASVAAIVPWYVRSVATPALGAALLALIRLEGRPFHLAALALLRYRATPRRLTGCWQRASVGAAWLPASLTMLPDGSDARIRGFRFAGPGAVLVAREHERTFAARRRAPVPRRDRVSGALTVRELADARVLEAGQVIALERGAGLVTESAGHVKARWARAADRVRPLGGRGGHEQAPR